MDGMGDGVGVAKKKRTFKNQKNGSDAKWMCWGTPLAAIC
jgi:hypothetical protein